MKLTVVITTFALLGSNVVAETYTMSPKYMNADISSTASYSGHPLRVGEITSSPYGRNAVLVFEMPKIPFGETITSATFKLNVADIPGTASFNGNLYSLGGSATGVPSFTTYYQGSYTSLPAYLTPIQQDLLVPGTSAGPVSASSGGNAAIAANIQDILDSGYEPYYLLSLSPDFTTASSANLGWDISAEQDPNPPSLTVTTSPALQIGRVLLEYWTGTNSNTGTSVPYLAPGAPNPTPPSAREYSTVLEIPQSMTPPTGMAPDSSDRLRGLFYVPLSGEYTFAISSDNDSVLYLSPDNNPNHAVARAWLTGQTTPYEDFTMYPSTQQYTTYLTAGTVCYIEAQHKSGSDGTSNMSIGWEPPTPLGSGSIVVMPATYVAPYDPGVDYAESGTSPIGGLVTAFAHPRLMISPAAVLRIAHEIKSNPYGNQANIWNKIYKVCTDTTVGDPNANDDMPMGDLQLKCPLINFAHAEAAQTATPPAAGPLLTSARDLQNRIYVLSIYYLVESQLNSSDPNLPLALTQIYNECYAAASWGTYGSHHGVWDVNTGSGGLDIAEMTHAFAIAYDWCYSGWNQTQINFFVNTISVNGLAEIDGEDGTKGPFGFQLNQLGSWPYANPSIEGNWGIVCNGGAILGALAIVNDETTTTIGTSNTPQAETVLNTLMPALPSLNSMVQFAPDGGWTEGPGYWDFAVKYLTVMFASLETTAATCFNMDQLSGMESTDSFIMYDTGPPSPTYPMGLTFNFADSLQSAYFVPGQQYLGLKYNEPLYSYPENITTNLKGHYPTDLLWYDGRVTAPDPTAPLSTYYSNMGLISLRNSWTSSTAEFVGILAGNNANAALPSGGPAVEHQMDQIGSFVFDALGVRWAEQMGSDSYLLPGYFDPVPWDSTNRWQIYHCRAEGNNTLVIAPTHTGGQYSYGTSSITKFVSNTNLQEAIINMTPAYSMSDSLTNPGTNAPGIPTAVTSANRGFRIEPETNGASSVMQEQDEVTTTSSQHLYWFMHTGQTVSAWNTNTVTLTDSSLTNHVLVTIQSPAGATWATPVKPSVPLTNSPDPAGQATNSTDTALSIQYYTPTTNAATTVTVTMAPYTGSTVNTNLAPLAPLSEW